MARPIIQRSEYNPLAFVPTDDQKTVPIPLFVVPTGMDTAKPISSIDYNSSPYVKNLLIDQGGVYATRSGSKALGTASAYRVLAAFLYRNASNAEYIIRITTSSVEFFDGTNWNLMIDGSATADVLALSAYDYVSLTAWGAYLMLMTSIGMYKIDISSATFQRVTTAPAAKTITTFGSRLVVSHVYSGVSLATRIQWSAKNNSDDWTGLGSGFEDLLAGPGGINDIEHGVFPINDYEAFVIRSGSIWLMSLTGYVDTPFAFTYLFGQGQVQCDSPYSIAAVPGGVIMLCRDNVYYVTRQVMIPIGDSIRSLIINSSLYLRRAVGVYDPRLGEYRLVALQKSFAGAQPVFRYNIGKKCWTIDYYPYQIKSLAPTIYEQSTSIGALSGTIGALSGPIGELGLNDLTQSFLLVEDGHNYVMHEDDDFVVDFNPNTGADNPIPIELQTGMITPSNILDRVCVQEQQLVVIPSRNLSFNIDYSIDAETWTRYSTVSPIASSIAKPYRALKPIERPQLMMRLIGTDCGGLRLPAWFVMAQKGAKVHQ